MANLLAKMIDRICNTGYTELDRLTILLDIQDQRIDRLAEKKGLTGNLLEDAYFGDQGEGHDAQSDRTQRVGARHGR